MTQITEEAPTRGRQRARRVTLNTKGILQSLALKTRPVAGQFVRDKVDGAVNITFTPDDGRTSQFRLSPEQAKELRLWLEDTARFEQMGL